MWKKNVKNKKQVICVPSTGREGRARLRIWVDGYSNPNCRGKMNTKQKKVSKKIWKRKWAIELHYKYSKGWNHGGHQTHLAKTGTYS